MVNVKTKGTQFERDAVKMLQKAIKDSQWRRMPTSGAMGTIMKEPLLSGDIQGRINGLSRKIVMEAKVGYGGATQMTLKRDWLDKVIKEAQQSYSIPMLIGKFSGSRGDVREFVIMDFDTFAFVMNHIVELDKQVTQMADEKHDMGHN